MGGRIDSLFFSGFFFLERMSEVADEAMWDASIMPVEDVASSEPPVSYFLESIKIENFKSYKGVFELGPFPVDNNPLVCVVGPNGSGKSNLMDAVAFCFHCADSRKLRGDGVASNLISSGCVGNASVSISLRSGNETIVFSRSVNARNESKYTINGSKVSLERYRESMSKCGMDARGSFLVFQGDVESLALCDPKSLGQIVDRVSGSSQLSKQYETLKEEKSALEKEYAVLASRKRKLMGDRKNLKSEVCEMEKIDSFLRQKSETINEFFLNKLFLIDSQRVADTFVSESGARSATEIAKEIKETENSIENAKSGRAKAEMKQSKLARQVILSEKDSQASRDRVDNLCLKEKTMNRRLVEIRSRIETRRTASDSIKSKFISVENRVKTENEKLETEMQIYQKLLNSGTVDIDAQRDREILGPFLSGLGVDMSGFKDQLSRLRTLEIPLQTGSLTDELSQVNVELSRENESLESVKRRKAEMHGQLARDEATERVVAEKVRELETAIENRSKEIKKLMKDYSQSKVGRLTNRKEKLESEKKLLLDELCDMQQSENEVNRERQTRATLMELQAKFGSDQIFGRFVDIVRPVEDRLAQAVQTAAGKYIDAVLVRDVGVARDAVAWLKNERKGTMMFVPVADVRSKVRSVPMECVSALECVQISSDEIRRGIEFILGDVAICESIKMARSVAYRGGSEGLTVVTINGEKINTNGTITLGGSHTSGSSKFGLKHVNEITSKLERIDKELDLVNADLRTEQIAAEKIANQIRAKELEMASETARLENVKNEFKRLSEAVKSIGNFMRQNQAELNRISEDLVSIQARKAEKQGEVQSTVKRVVREFFLSALKYSGQVDEDVLLAFGGSVNDPTMSAKAQLEESKKRQKAIVESVVTTIEGLQSERRCLELELTELGDVRELEKDEAATDKSRIQLEKDLEKAQKEFETISQTLQDFRVQIEQIKVQKQATETEIKQLISRMQTLRQEETVCKTESLRIKKCNERIKNSKVQVLKEAVVRNAYLPLKLEAEDLAMGSQEEVSRRIIESVFVSLSAVVPFRTQISENQEDESMESLIDEVLDKIDFSSVKSELKRRASNATKKNRLTMVIADLEQEFTSELHRLESEIESVSGNISRATRTGVDSRTALSQIETEIAEVSASADRVKTRLAETSQRLGTLTEERNMKFMKCFDFVAKKVDQLYKILTSYDDALSSGGEGSYALVASSTAAASLDLESPVSSTSDLKSVEALNSGVVLALMPPFKRYTNIELLSGGEKTVAAVALLFSLLAYSAPPFSMVDEIDAALDAENVAVLSRFMKHAVPHQLLVISLKECLYAKADCLVGVYKDAHTQGSGLVTVDLRPYPEEEPAVPATVGRTEKTKGPMMTPGFTPAPVTARREGRVMMGGA